MLFCMSQTIAQDKLLNTGNVSKDETNVGLDKSLAPNSCNTTLTTPVTGGNSNSGVMFDIVASENVIIKNVGSVFSTSGTIVVEVYTRPGTHVGAEGSNTGWTLRGDVRMTGVTAGTVTEIPVAIYERLAAGQVMGVYIHIVSVADLEYTNGTNVGDTIVSDGSIAILEGTGLDNFGGTPFVARNLNGFVTYCGDMVCYADFTNAATSYTTNNGNDGNIFEITALQDFTLKGFYTNCNGTGGWEVYYRNGSYSGFTGSLSNWILLDSLSITCAGVDDTTAIPLPVYMDISAGQTVSFYITGTATGADINYFDGTTEGAIYQNYGSFVIKEGLGVAYPLANTFSPRVFSGGIDYCQQGFLGTNELKNQYSVLVYPNPARDVIHFSIDHASHIGEYTVTIKDMQGRMIAISEHNTNSNITIDTQTLDNGVYFYDVESANESISKGTFVKN